LTTFSSLPDPATFGPNELLEETKLNTGVRDPARFEQDRPQASLRQTVAQSVAGGTAEAVQFNAEDTDNYNGHDNATNNTRYTAVIAGKYQLSGGIGFASNATGFRSAVWRKNGAVINGSAVNIPTISGTPSLIPARTITVYLNVGDYVELWAFQNSGGALNTSVATGDQPSMHVLYVGSTAT
jgi:hypothetical protein